MMHQKNAMKLNPGGGADGTYLTTGLTLFGSKTLKNTLNFKYDQLQGNFILCGLKVKISKKI